MDSGLGSDEERRTSNSSNGGRTTTTTKQQKQLHNQRLLSGCFIDASSLTDDGDVSEERRSEERRQGALIFQTSIPQFSMLQMSSSEVSQYVYRTMICFLTLIVVYRHIDIYITANRHRNCIAMRKLVSFLMFKILHVGLLRGEWHISGASTGTKHPLQFHRPIGHSRFV